MDFFLFYCSFGVVSLCLAHAMTDTNVAVNNPLIRDLLHRDTEQNVSSAIHQSHKPLPLQTIPEENEMERETHLNFQTRYPPFHQNKKLTEDKKSDKSDEAKAPPQSTHLHTPPIVKVDRVNVEVAKKENAADGDIPNFSRPLRRRQRADYWCATEHILREYLDE